MGKNVERVRKYCIYPLPWGAYTQDHYNLRFNPQTEMDLSIDTVLTQNPSH